MKFSNMREYLNDLKFVKDSLNLTKDVPIVTDIINWASPKQ